MMKNVSTNAYQITQIQTNFYEAYKKLLSIKEAFLDQVFEDIHINDTLRKDFINSYYDS